MPQSAGSSVHDPAGTHWSARLPTRADWTFYAGPWPVIVVSGLGVLAGFAVRILVGAR